MCIYHAEQIKSADLEEIFSQKKKKIYIKYYHNILINVRNIDQKKFS